MVHVFYFASIARFLTLLAVNWCYLHVSIPRSLRFLIFFKFTSLNSINLNTIFLPDNWLRTSCNEGCFKANHSSTPVDGRRAYSYCTRISAIHRWFLFPSSINDHCSWIVHLLLSAAVAICARKVSCVRNAWCSLLLTLLCVLCYMLCWLGSGATAFGCTFAAASGSAGKRNSTNETSSIAYHDTHFQTAILASMAALGFLGCEFGYNRYLPWHF